MQHIHAPIMFCKLNNHLKIEYQQHDWPFQLNRKHWYVQKIPYASYEYYYAIEF